MATPRAAAVGDLAPASLEALGLPIPDPMPGASLVPLISGRDVSW